MGCSVGVMSPIYICVISHSLLSAFQEYVVASPDPTMRVIENKEKLPWYNYVGICGMPGKRFSAEHHTTIRQ